MGMLILAGNTLYPCFLRFIIWSMRILLPGGPAWTSWRVTLDFILDHPRRVYTNLFPARHTWYLLGTIIFLNGIDWAAFELLSIGNLEIEALPSEYRVLDGLFQALGLLLSSSCVSMANCVKLFGLVGSMLLLSLICGKGFSFYMVSHSFAPSFLAIKTNVTLVLMMVRHPRGPQILSIETKTDKP